MLSTEAREATPKGLTFIRGSFEMRMAFGRISNLAIVGWGKTREFSGDIDEQSQMILYMPWFLLDSVSRFIT